MRANKYFYESEFDNAYLGDVLVHSGERPLYAIRTRECWATVDLSGMQETTSDELARFCKGTRTHFVKLWAAGRNTEDLSFLFRNE